jgi:hypothetical protein
MLDYSAICGVARVVDVVTNSRSKWFWHPDDGSTNYGWVLVNATPLKTPIRCKGALRLWDVPPKVFSDIQRQLPKLEREAAFDSIDGRRGGAFFSRSSG